MAKDLQTAVNRFKDAGISNTDRYEEGTRGKGSAWASSKQRAKENFKVGMAEALSKGSYEKGMDNSQASDYDSGVLNKGKANWGVGMQAGGEKYSKNISKFVPLWGQALPTGRGAKRSASNIKRMTENVERFVKAKGN